MAGTFPAVSMPTWNAQQGFHYVVGPLTPAVPTAFNAMFLMQAATKPTAADGATPVGETTGNMKVEWNGGVPKIALDIYVVFSGKASYHFVTTGGFSDPLQSEIAGTGDSRFQGEITLDQGSEDIVPACGVNAGTDCTAVIQGFFAGERATHAALTFTISDGGDGVHGAALLRL